MDSNTKMEMSVLASNNADVSTKMDGSNDATCSATVPTADTSEIQRYLYYTVYNMYVVM